MPERAGTALALTLWLAALGGIAALDDPRLRFPQFLLLAGLAIGAWLWIGARAARGALPPGTLRVAIALGLLARLGGVLEAPAFSEDVFRYIYEGRAVWRLGPGFPFVHAPAEAPGLGLDDLIDGAWLRINHPHLSTIYPPLAQLVFSVAAGAGELAGGRHLLFIKLALTGADLATFWLIVRALERTGRRAEEALIYLLCPVLILEVAREGHADSLAAAGLALGVAGFIGARPKVGYLGFALAALAKLNGLIAALAAARVERRGLLWPGAVLASLIALPLLLAGPGASTGLVTYGTSWRSGDGAFSLFLAVAEATLGGDWRDIAGVTVTRHGLARALSALAFAGGAWWLLRRPYPRAAIPAQAAALLLLLLLLGPTLHPWYVLWLLPLVPFAGRWRAPAIALISLSPLAHHASWLELERGIWTDVGWVRGLIHVPVWVLVVRTLWRTEGDLAPEAR